MGSNTESMTAAAAHGNLRPMRLTDRDIELLEAGLDEEGAMIVSDPDIRRVVRLFKAGLVRIDNAMPGTPMIYVTTVAGMAALGRAGR